MNTRIEKLRNQHRIYLKQIGPQEYKKEEAKQRLLLRDAIVKNNNQLLANRLFHCMLFSQDTYPRNIAHVLIYGASHLLEMKSNPKLTFDAFEVASKRALDPKTEKIASKRAIKALDQINMKPKEKAGFIYENCGQLGSPKLKRALARTYYQTVFKIKHPAERSNYFRLWLDSDSENAPYFKRRSLIGLIENAKTLFTPEEQIRDYKLALSYIKDTESIYYEIAQRGHKEAANKLTIDFLNSSQTIFRENTVPIKHGHKPSLSSTPIFGLRQNTHQQTSIPA